MLGQSPNIIAFLSINHHLPSKSSPHLVFLSVNPLDGEITSTQVSSVPPPDVCAIFFHHCQLAFGGFDEQMRNQALQTASKSSCIDTQNLVPCTPFHDNSFIGWSSSQARLTKPVIIGGRIRVCTRTSIVGFPKGHRREGGVETCRRFLASVFFFTESRSYMRRGQFG
jgi:hypothetical protein